MNIDSQLETIKKFKSWDEAGKLEAYLPHRIEERWQSLLAILDQKPVTVEAFNQLIHLETHLIDARKTPFSDQSFDFICSNNTFEHIPKNILVDIIKEFKRLLKKGGVMSHFIDMTDHFAHFDRSITDYNFLRFSEKQWRIIDNSIQPQNRMRWADYLAIYNELAIAILEENTRPGNWAALKGLKLHADFSHLAHKEIAISHGYIVTN